MLGIAKLCLQEEKRIKLVLSSMTNPFAILVEFSRIWNAIILHDSFLCVGHGHFLATYPISLMSHTLMKLFTVVMHTSFSFNFKFNF